MANRRSRFASKAGFVRMSSTTGVKSADVPITVTWSPPVSPAWPLASSANWPDSSVWAV